MTNNLIGLIPAAGKGVRLGLPYPKELYPIVRNNRYKPVSQFVVENLVASGAKDIVFVINETKHQLIGYFGNGHRFNCHFTYAVQEQRGDADASTSPGLAHALDSAYHLTKGKTVLFGMADTIMYPVDLFRYLIEATQPDEQFTLGLFETALPEKFGMVDLDETGRIRHIDDKPTQTDLKYAWGCIVWQPEFTEYLHWAVNEAHISDFAKIMNDALAKNMLGRGVVVPKGSYSDMGTYDEIMELEQQFADGNFFALSSVK